jgi:hypothetical protein
MKIFTGYLLILLCSCQRSTYIVFKSHNEHFADTIKIGIGLAVINNYNSPDEIRIDTAYLKKFIRKSNQ